MGTAYISVKFTPAVKYFPKTNSNNCWLEIVPTVSCIKNLDRIEWSQHKGSVEYIVPMTYKIILKKREPKRHLRVYYSCIDLLSSVTSLNLNDGDVHRHISDNFIVSKAINENFENIQGFGLKINSKKHEVKAHSKVSDVACLPISKGKQTENIQETNNSEYKSIEKHSILQEDRTETENKIDRRNSHDISNSVFYINGDNKNRENVQKKLCITKVYNISTADKISSNNYVNPDFITKSCFNTSIHRIDPNNIESKNIELLENIYRPLRTTWLNSFVRVEPEIRIAQFVENMEKEVFPLKVLLNDILKKCATLGLKESMPSNDSEVNKCLSLKAKCNNKTFEVQKEEQSNRVVYSIVFEMTNGNHLDQTICNLPFEVVAIYDNGSQILQQNTNSNVPPPVNVKIRIRNKEVTGTGRHGIISVPKLTAKNWPKRIRLVNSAQTIMSFNLALEPNSDEAPKKSNRSLFQMFRPGGCLSIHRDEDGYSYLPSTSNKLNRKSTSGIEDYESSKITGAFALKKNDCSSSYTNTLKTPKTFLGKCKPGGCLDPPFNEDKYTYKPTVEDERSLQKRDINTNSLHSDINIMVIKTKSTSQDQQINISHQLYPETKILDNTETLVTYPSTLSSSKLKTKDSQNEKPNLRMLSEQFELSRKLTSEFPEAYFIPPRKEKTKNGKSYDRYSYEEKEPKIKEAYVNKDYILQSQTPSELLSEALTITSQSIDEPTLGVIKEKQMIREINSITPLLLKSEDFLNNKTSKDNVKTIRTTVPAKGMKIDENTFLQDQNSSNHNSIPIIKHIFSNIKENENVIYKRISRLNSSIQINAIQETTDEVNYKKKADPNNNLDFEERHQSMLCSLDLSNENSTKPSKNSIDQTRIPLNHFEIREENNLLRQHQNVFNNDINKAEITDIKQQVEERNEENNLINPFKVKKSDSLEYEYAKNISGPVISNLIIKDDTNSETDHPKSLVARRSDDKNNNISKYSNENIIENISEHSKLLVQGSEFKDNDYNTKELVYQGIERRTEPIIDIHPSVLPAILPKVTSLHSLDKILSLKNSNSVPISPKNSYVNQKDPLLSNKSSKSKQLKNEKNSADIHNENKKSFDTSSSANMLSSFLIAESSQKTELDSIHAGFGMTNETNEKNNAYIHNENKNSFDTSSSANMLSSFLIAESSQKTELDSIHAGFGMTNETNEKNSADIHNENKKSFDTSSSANMLSSFLIAESSQKTELDSIHAGFGMTNETNEKNNAYIHNENKNSFDTSSSANMLSSFLITESSQKTELDSIHAGFAMTLESQEKNYEISSNHEKQGDTDIKIISKMLQLSYPSLNKIELDNHNRTESQQALSISPNLKTSKDTLETIESVPQSLQKFTDLNSLQYRSSLNYSTSKQEENLNTFINDSKTLLPNLESDINISKIDIMSGDEFRNPSNELTMNNMTSLQTLPNTIFNKKSDKSFDKFLEGLDKSESHMEASEKKSSQLFDNIQELKIIDPRLKVKRSFTRSNKNLNSISSIAINFGFHSIINEETGFSIETIDPSINLGSYPQDKIVTIKTILRKNDSQIKVKIDSETDLTMQIKPTRQLGGSRKLASNVLNNDTNDRRRDSIRVYSSEVLINKDKLLQETLKAVYETLMPIEKNIIKLKEEAESLYREQLLLKEILFSKEVKANIVIPKVRTCSCLQREIGLDMKNY